MLPKSLTFVSAFLALVLTMVQPAQAQQLGKTWLDQHIATAPTYTEGNRRHYLSGGSFSGRYRMSNDYLFSITRPRIEASCGGIDIFTGGVSFLDPEFMIQKMENILQAAPAFAFSMALGALCKDCEHYVSKLNAAIDKLNALQMSDCALAKQLAASASNRFVKTGVGQGIKSTITSTAQHYGLEKNASDTNDDISAANGRSPIDLHTAIEACPQPLLDLFTTGSVASTAANLSGAGDIDELIRGLLGDLSANFPDTDTEPSFELLPPCPENKDVSLEDVVHGRTFIRKRSDDSCVQQAGTTLFEYTQDNLVNISTKIETGQAYTAEEESFLSVSRSSRVQERLEAAVYNGVVAETIYVSVEAIASEIAYSALQDFYWNVASIAASARSVTSIDGRDPSAAATLPKCARELFTEGFEYLHNLEQEVVRRGSETRSELALVYNEERSLRDRINSVYAQRGIDDDEFGDGMQ